MFEKKRKKTRDLTLSSSLSFWFANDGLVGWVVFGLCDLFSFSYCADDTNDHY